MKAETKVYNSSLRISKRRKEFLRNWQLYCMIFIPLVYIIIFNYVPMFGIAIAFEKYNPVKGIFGSQFVGLKYFEKFFTSPKFWIILRNTLVVSLYNIIAGFPLPIILALGLNALRSEKYKKTVQMVTYMPHFVSTVVLVGILMQIINPRIGIVGNIYHALTGNVMDDLMSSPAAFPHLYVWSGIWQNMGWSTVIYMAALASVDSSQTEAAMIDGATRFQRVVHIDFPAILPTIVIMLILEAGNVMSVGFEKVFLMQNSLNIGMSEVISTYSYKIGLNIGGGDFSYGTAIGLFNSVVNLILLVIVNQISKRLTETSLW